MLARRTFLATGASLALPLPQAVARFFSDPTVTDPLVRDTAPEGRELLRASLASAKSLGKPLLALIVPATGDTSDDWRLRRERGEDLGGWLDAMDDRELAWLAWCEVGCATTRELLDVLGSTDDEPSAGTNDPPTARSAGDPRTAGSVGAAIDPATGPWMFLVEAAGDAPRARVVPAPRSDWRETWAPDLGESREAFAARQARAKEHVFREISARLVEVLAPDDAAWSRRAEECRSTLLDVECERVEAALAGPRAIDSSLADRAAPWLATLARSAPEARGAAARVALAEAARKRLLSRPPSGAWWAKSGPCGGLLVEEEGKITSKWSAPCGAAALPAHAKRFLAFYTADPRYHR